MAENGIAQAKDFRRAAEAKRRQGAVRLELPSGLAILARRPDPLAWVMRGRLPQRLLALAQFRGRNGKGSEPIEGLGREELEELAKFLRELVVETVIEPRLSLTPGPGEIHPADVPDEDFFFIFRWACGEDLSASDDADHPSQEGATPSSGGVARFRPERTVSVPRRDSDALRRAAFEDGGH